MPLEPLTTSGRLLGSRCWRSMGTNLRQVLDALDTALEIHSQPTVIVPIRPRARACPLWRTPRSGTGPSPTAEQYARARAELQEGA
jgi:hypothetical protein